MATRQEQTGVRDLTFSRWIRRKCPDSSTGFMVSDLDFIIYDYKAKNIMFIEVKTRGAKLREWQRILFNHISKWVKNGISEDWKFYGFHTIQFTNTSFNDGLCKFDGVDVTENELLDILSFKKTHIYPNHLTP